MPIINNYESLESWLHNPPGTFDPAMPEVIATVLEVDNEHGKVVSLINKDEEASKEDWDKLISYFRSYKWPGEVLFSDNFTIVEVYNY